jgi:hypothetical protein
MPTRRADSSAFKLPWGRFEPTLADLGIGRTYPSAEGEPPHEDETTVMTKGWGSAGVFSGVTLDGHA